MNPHCLKISSHWRRVLFKEFEAPYFEKLCLTLKQAKEQGKIIYPPEDKIFDAYNSVIPSDVKVVIIGQDPYHNPGEAMGLSFSVPKDVKIPPSLRNIYKELSVDRAIPPAQHGDLTAWTQQGVFLLNAVLTVEHKSPASHRNIGWQTFTDATLSYLSTYHEHIVFMLWGNFAKAKKPWIDSDKHLILESAHPSPLARNAFQGCRHFSQANSYLEECGRGGVRWEL